ncbi:MAG: hypothetical protein HW388_217 [Dehalococcoidia bacterium]|nr:hypothetical protein [Dehalococcoidia bacterium]
MVSLLELVVTARKVGKGFGNPAFIIPPRLGSPHAGLYPGSWVRVAADCLGVAVGAAVAVTVGTAVAVGTKVAVGVGAPGTRVAVAVGTKVAVGTVVAVAAGARVAVGGEVGVAFSPAHARPTPSMAITSTVRTCP